MSRTFSIDQDGRTALIPLRLASLLQEQPADGKDGLEVRPEDLPEPAALAQATEHAPRASRALSLPPPLEDRFLERPALSLTTSGQHPRSSEVGTASRDNQSQRRGTPGFSLLAVEDDPDLLDLYEVVARRAGAERFWGCINGLQALELIQQYQPDLILVDLILPGLDGLSLLERLRSTLGPEEVPPAVVISGSIHLPALQERLEAAGARVVLPKPVALEQLQSTLALQARAGQRARAAVNG